MTYKESLEKIDNLKKKIKDTKEKCLKDLNKKYEEWNGKYVCLTNDNGAEFKGFWKGFRIGTYGDINIDMRYSKKDHTPSEKTIWIWETNIDYDDVHLKEIEIED